MKTAVIIPDRGDRPQFVTHCKKLLERQTILPTYTFICNWKAVSEKKDITQRYRIAYNMVSQLDVDCILFVENDDWYSESYLETMLLEWQKAGKPDLFGIDYTIYYHVGLRIWRKFPHSKRASMMNTLIRPGLNINWCKDDEPYTDLHLWTGQPELSKGLIAPEVPISMGIKHGTGMTGGNYHDTSLRHYNKTDYDLTFLSGVVDKESLEFYAAMSDVSWNEVLNKEPLSENPFLSSKQHGFFGKKNSF